MTHDDCVVIGSLYFHEYEDLRRGPFMRYSNYQRTKNIDFHHNKIVGGKRHRAISFTSWSCNQPDPRDNELSGVCLHNNTS